MLRHSCHSGLVVSVKHKPRTTWVPDTLFCTINLRAPNDMSAVTRSQKFRYRHRTCTSNINHPHKNKRWPADGRLPHTECRHSSWLFWWWYRPPPLTHPMYQKTIVLFDGYFFDHVGARCTWTYATINTIVTNTYTHNNQPLKYMIWGQSDNNIIEVMTLLLSLVGRRFVLAIGCSMLLVSSYEVMHWEYYTCINLDQTTKAILNTTINLHGGDTRWCNNQSAAITYDATINLQRRY